MSAFVNVRKLNLVRFVAGPYGFKCKVLAVSHDSTVSLVRVSGSRRLFHSAELYTTRELAVEAWASFSRVPKSERPHPFPVCREVDIFALSLSPLEYSDTDLVAA